MNFRPFILTSVIILLFLVLPGYAYSAATSLGAFHNYSPITINDNSAASLYPSNITVAGISVTVEKVLVRLYGVNHTWPADIGVLLVGPKGQKLVLIDKLQDSTPPIVNANITFDDTGSLFNGNLITSSFYKPTNQTLAEFPVPAPIGTYSVTPLSTFNSLDPNGSWQLYVRDSGTGDFGTIAGGWEIEFFTLQPAPSFTVEVPPGNITAGIPFEVKVTAKNSDGSNFTGLVSFSITDTVIGEILPADYTFVQSDNGVRIFRGVSLITLGTRTITVTDSKGFKGNSAAFTVVAPPQITKHPQDATIFSGQTATLDVTATGSGLEYRWYQGTKGDITTPAPGTNTNSSYTTPALLGPADYWVNVAGTIGAVESSTAHVITLIAPFSNTTAIAINDNAVATPYPSSISVSGITETVAKLRVSLFGVNHTWPQDIGILLVGPKGQKLVLMDHVGSFKSIDNATIIFDDDGSPLITADKIISGTYQPTNQTEAEFPVPAPIGTCSATPLSTFNSLDPNGTWNLYVRDSGAGNYGIISGGWQIDFQIPSYSLTASLDGTGNGTVTSSPQVSGSISCQKGSNTNCTGSFASAVLTATKSLGSIFSGWSGDCTGKTACTFTPMSANKSVTATFNITPPFYLSSSDIYPTEPTLQGVYNNLSPDSSTVIQMQATMPAGAADGLSAALTKTITLMGGYDADFKPNPDNTSFSTIQGKLEIANVDGSSGKFTVQRVKVRPVP
jgi:subtilisin-like proprotein convertase family protein